MSLLHDVLQDVGLAIDRPHSFLSFYSYLINCPIVLCEMLSRYSRQNDDVGSFVPMMKSDLLRLLYHPPNNILNDFPLHTRVMLISHVAEIFELLASWTLNQYEYDDEKSSPFYDAVENGRFSLDGSAYGQLKVNETLQQLLTDNEVYSILKHESYEFNSRQIEMDFSQRKAS